MYRFQVRGSEQITAKHRTTLEFTKDFSVTQAGDCIVGRGADFRLSELKRLLSYPKLKCVIKGKNCREVIVFTPNPSFHHEEEMVIRRSDFVCKRTFGIYASKAAGDLRDDCRQELKNKDAKLQVIISPC